MIILYSILFLLVAITLIIICFEVIPVFFHLIKRIFFSFSNRDDEKRDVLVKEFLSSNLPGRSFIKLIYAGQLRTIKSGNHGANFPDARQLKTFEKYATEEISHALNIIGEDL